MFHVTWHLALGRRCKVEFSEPDGPSGPVRVDIHTFEPGSEVPSRTESAPLTAALPHLFKPTGRYRFGLHHLNLAVVEPADRDLFRAVVTTCHDFQTRRGVRLDFGGVMGAVV